MLGCGGRVLDVSDCGTEHLCGGNNPLSLVVVGVSARTFLSLWACAARLPFGFSSWNFGDDSPCFMPVRQVSESRYHDFLRRSSQQCSAVQFTVRVSGVRRFHLFFFFFGVVVFRVRKTPMRVVTTTSSGGLLSSFCCAVHDSRVGARCIFFCDRSLWWPSDGTSRCVLCYFCPVLDNPGTCRNCGDLFVECVVSYLFCGLSLGLWHCSLCLCRVTLLFASLRSWPFWSR